MPLKHVPSQLQEHFAIDTICGRENHSFLSAFPQVCFPHSSGWPHAHGCMRSTNETYPNNGLNFIKLIRSFFLFVHYSLNFYLIFLGGCIWKYMIFFFFWQKFHSSFSAQPDYQISESLIWGLFWTAKHLPGLGPHWIIWSLSSDLLRGIFFLISWIFLSVAMSAYLILGLPVSLSGDYHILWSCLFLECLCFEHFPPPSARENWWPSLLHWNWHLFPSL